MGYFTPSRHGVWGGAAHARGATYVGAYKE